VGRLTSEVYVGDGFLAADDGYIRHLTDTARRAREAEVWVAVGEGRLLGTVTFCRPGSAFREIGRADEGEFRMLAVAPAARGRGVGEALVRQCEERAAATGATRMWLSTLDEMGHAQRIYTRLGYRPESARDWDPQPELLPDVHLRAWTKEL